MLCVKKIQYIPIEITSLNIMKTFSNSKIEKQWGVTGKWDEMNHFNYKNKKNVNIFIRQEISKKTEGIW